MPCICFIVLGLLIEASDEIHLYVVLATNLLKVTTEPRDLTKDIYIYQNRGW